MAYRRRRTFKKRTFRRKTAGRFNRRRTFQSRVTRVLMKKAETKVNFFVVERGGLYHDRGAGSAGALTTNQGSVVFNPWQQITNGTNRSTRIGDEIQPTGFSMRIYYTTAAARASQFVRIIVAVIPKISGTTILDGSNFDLLDPSGSNDTVTGIIKNENVKVLYDRLITMKSQQTQATQLEGDNRFFKKIWIKSKRGKKIAWDQATGLIVNRPVGVWVIPYDNYGSLRTDVLGYVTFTGKMFFKDI